MEAVSSVEGKDDSVRKVSFYGFSIAMAAIQMIPNEQGRLRDRYE